MTKELLTDIVGLEAPLKKGFVPFGAAAATSSAGLLARAAAKSGLLATAAASAGAIMDPLLNDKVEALLFVITSLSVA